MNTLTFKFLQSSPSLLPKPGEWFIRHDDEYGRLLCYCYDHNMYIVIADDEGSPWTPIAPDYLDDLSPRNIEILPRIEKYEF